MKRTRFTDEQIIGILAEHAAGAKAGNLALALMKSRSLTCEPDTRSAAQEWTKPFQVNRFQ